MKKISIITPCYNSEKYIKETMLSVFNQTALLSNRCELEYIICDGASSDETLSIIKTFKNDSIKIISEKDSGMYEALAKGLSLASGDIVAYLNAGDSYYETAFDAVLDVFGNNDTKWITGNNNTYNEKTGEIKTFFPYKYRSDFFQYGFYGTNMPFVQQESTFWRQKLNQFIDLEKLSKFKGAGDFYLWQIFSKHCELKVVRANLGRFLIHAGQISENIEAYKQEILSISKKPSVYAKVQSFIDRIIWQAPNWLKVILNRKNTIVCGNKY